IQRAVDQNLDLRTAAKRVQEARLHRGLKEAESFPVLDASGSTGWSRSNDQTGAEHYGIGLDASWEIDLFGSVRRSIEAADADFQAQQERLRDVLVSLTAEVALNYVGLRTAQVQLANVSKSLETQQESLQLVQWQHEAGLEGELAVHQALYTVESSRARTPELEHSIKTAMNRLAVLLGERPGSLHEELKSAKPIPKIPATVAVGLPADALRRRPDIRQAESELIAQTARVGVATAALYPKLPLNGSIGINALSFARFAENFVNPAIWAEQIGLSTAQTLFDAGAVRKKIKIQSSQQRQALIRYEATLLTALEETENALTAYVQEQSKRDSLNRALQEAKQVLVLAEKSYKSGLIDFKTVLDSQRNLLSLDNQVAASESAMVVNLIQLYKALGGGWPCCAAAALDSAR
ncbi:MAG: efflux transporter outer membrane subunit, partial [Candidatus Electrothrix sp. AR3]|nr:efflux transporter outer membrane subunit [Candidatus Electrothrix sp. AR3]